MNVLYLSCFPENDVVEEPLNELIRDLKATDSDVRVATIPTADALRDFLLCEDFSDCDILILGAHGHGSKTGFCVREQKVRWHDLAALLKDALPKTCTFIFYSCNGGYPGIGHALSKSSGPDFIFAPYIRVLPDAMTYAVKAVIDSKRSGMKTPEDASQLVERINRWAAETYFGKYDRSFLRVLWKSGHRISRYPNTRSSDRPTKAPIKIRAWKRSPSARTASPLKRKIKK
jgi:hypothetical protein